MTGALTRKVTGMTTGATTCDPPTACWCAALPHAPMPAQTADCLCPACLCRDLGVSLDLLGKSAAELRTWMAAFGEPAYRGAQLYKAIYAARRFDFTTMTDLPAPLRARLAAAARIAIPEISRRYHSADGSVRYLLSLAGSPAGGSGAAIPAARVETVFMPSEGRQQAPTMAQGESQQCRRVRRVDLLFPDLGQYNHSSLLHLRQGNRLPGHAPRVTDLLFTYGVTLSLFIHKHEPGHCA